MYKSLKGLALNGAHQSGILRGLHALDFSRNALYVLAYHRVDWEAAQPRLDPQNLSATPEQFERQMRLLADEYQPVAAEDVLNAALGNKKLPLRAVLITVDDGYRDFKNHIYPIASRYGIHPVLFVPTAYVGSGVFWWDQLYDALNRTTLAQAETHVGTLSLKNLPDRHHAFAQLVQYMKKAPFDSALIMLNDLCCELVPDPFSGERVTLDWDELRELARDGVTIAPHTHTHPALGNISAEQARYEVAESQRLVTNEIGSFSPLFAYSYGLPEAIGDTGKIVRELGCQLAFTMKPGRARLDEDDRTYLPRIEVNPTITLAKFHARLSSLYDFFARRK